MTYQKTEWKNGQQGGTAIDAAKLNKIEQGIYENSTALEVLPNFDDFVREDELPNFSEFALASDIPDITPLATKAELDPLASTAEVEDMIADIPPPDLSSYATQDYVTNAINQAIIDGSDAPVDLSAYALRTEIENKVDKVPGKGLSTNDYTNVEKVKLASLENFDPTSLQTQVNNKVDKEAGKGLSSNDYTITEKNKLAGIESGAQKNPDLSNYATLNDLNAIPAIYSSDGVIANPKIWVGTATADSNGNWTCDYSSAGFSQIIGINTTGFAKGTALADRLLSCVGSVAPTLTQCTGKLMSASGAGLLVAVTLTESSGTVYVTVYGK